MTAEAAEPLTAENAMEGGGGGGNEGGEGAHVGDVSGTGVAGGCGSIPRHIHIL